MPSQFQIRQTITEQIANALKEGKTLPWRTPWVRHPCAGLPTNIVSNRRYSGINVLLLNLLLSLAIFDSGA